MTDYFEVFGLPRKLQIDLDALQRSFYELSRRHHPDFHQGAGAEDQARALEASALVNRAYRALRDPVRRVEYLIALEEGREVREETTAKAKVPMDLLAEMLEVQEALEDAKSSGLTDEAAEGLRAERQRLRGALPGRGERADRRGARMGCRRRRGRASGNRCSSDSSSGWPRVPICVP